MVAISFRVTDRLRYVMIASIPDAIAHQGIWQNYRGLPLAVNWVKSKPQTAIFWKISISPQKSPLSAVSYVLGSGASQEKQNTIRSW